MYCNRTHTKGKDLCLAFLSENLHLHEVGVIVLSEIVLTLKLNTVKDLITKISIHFLISSLLMTLGSVIMHVGGQTIPFDR
jgi:hypothetical protein